MKSFVKKASSIVLISVMLFTLIPFSASAMAGTDNNSDETPEIPAATTAQFHYTILNDGTINITSYKGEASDLSIPSLIDGHTVTGIGEYAFYNHTELTTVTIPESVTCIGDYAFYNCTELTTINIPDSVINIPLDNAFDGCSNLRCIIVDNKNPEYCSVNGDIYKKKTEATNTQNFIWGTDNWNFNNKRLFPRTSG